MIVLRTFVIPLIMLISMQAVAEQKYSWQIQVFDNKTKKPIENATISNEVEDKSNGKITNLSCATNTDGKCTISETVEGGFFTGSSITYKLQIAKTGYEIPKTYLIQKPKLTDHIITYNLTKEGESKYSIVYYEDLFDIKDDELEVRATIDTYPAHKQDSKFGSDIVFLRAFVDKKDGKAIYQVYALLTYYGNGFHRYNTGVVSTPTGPVAVVVKSIDSHVDCANKNILNNKECGYEETLAIEMDELLFRQIASVFQTQVKGEWKFRLKAHSGNDKNLSLPYAEMAAFLDRVDKYSAKISK